MKNFKTITLSFALLMALSISFTSCDEKDSEPEVNQHNDAFGDVFIQKLMMAGNTRYGLVFYAGGEGLVSCKATAPDGTEFTLTEYWKGAGNLRRHPDPTELQGTMFETGDYVFTLTFDDGETKNITDVLSAVEIDPITGVNVTYDATTETVVAAWNAIDNIDGYMIKLTDHEKNKNKPIFVNQMPNTMLDYTFDRSTTANPGWMQTGVPVSADINWVFVVGIKYEAGIDAATKGQNKQCLTARPTMITW